MIYPYTCHYCGHTDEIFKPASEASATEMCPVCEHQLTRIYTVPAAIVHNTTYNPGLGCMDNGHSTLRDINAKRRDTGKSELIAIGSEDPKLTRKHNNYELTPKELAGIQEKIVNA